ncbi:ImmA/IrrE family metallo-endopeptidase [uncultured Imperialibacter sp.]|uniref:ImmA/IrrE family metallo-endopeptidase n=1 Tax=uncultured Imperialibacter sp. TaxID=1672639 RepID=UPI0030D7DB7C|tara:strand:+ start:13225 stop:14061 length:837 start_codon:yes stop_codon:yes gene_type:complete
MILPHRKIQISKLAEDIAYQFSNRNLTLLNEIAKFEDVPIHYDNYENAFDGMLLYDTDTQDFHIHINNDNGNRQDSKRGRFTLAHELGHFFLDEHRLGLKYGLLEPHASFHNINQKTLIEEEADYFASCLLMPTNKFKNHSSEYRKRTGRNGFSFDTVQTLSESFQTSVLSTLIRFGEVGTHEIFAIISKDNIVKWYVKSTDFPNWKWKFQIGGLVPPTTVAGEYYNLENKKVTTTESLKADDWFNPPPDDYRADREMYEQCFYADNYGYVVSLLWFD